MSWTIGGSPQREPGVVCHNEKCGARDAVTNVCNSNFGKLCKDRVATTEDTEGKN